LQDVERRENKSAYDRRHRKDGQESRAHWKNYRERKGEREETERGKRNRRERARQKGGEGGKGWGGRESEHEIEEM